MKLRTKILLTILAAVLCSLLMQHFDPEAQAKTKGRLNVVRLAESYKVYNERFFGNKLPKDTIMSDSLTDARYMATTSKHGNQFQIDFNPVYTAAERVADETMLHEMCHVKTWDKNPDDDFDEGQQYDHDHGARWRACMLQIDMVGGFREITIDKYREAL